MSLDDNILRMYIDEAFEVFDINRSGTLDRKELHTFFNQLYASLNEKRNLTETDIANLIQSCDINHDNQLTKPEIFMLFKKLMANPYPSPNQFGGNQYNQFGGNQYGQNQYNPNQYNPNQNPYQPPNIPPNQFGQNQYGQPQNPGQYGFNPYQKWFTQLLCRKILISFVILTDWLFLLLLN